MIRVLKLDFKRAVFNKQFGVVILIGILLAVLPLYKIFHNNVMYDGAASGYYSPFRLWLSKDVSSIYPTIFFMIFPVLANISFSDSYWIDKNSGFTKSVCTRCKKSNYIISKYIINFVIGGISVIIPLLVSLYILFMTLPAVKPSVFYQYDLAKSMFSNLYYAHSYIYIAAYLCISFMFGGVYASIGLSVSTFSKNKFSIVAIPALAYISMYMLETMGFPQLVPLIFLSAAQPVFGINIISITIIFMILFIASLCLYIVGVKNDEVI